jgi:hypothetical protein
MANAFPNTSLTLTHHDPTRSVCLSPPFPERKLRHREFKELARKHRNGKWQRQSQVLASGLPTSVPHCSVLCLTVACAKALAPGRRAHQGIASHGEWERLAAQALFTETLLGRVTAAPT